MLTWHAVTWRLNGNPILMHQSCIWTGIAWIAPLNTFCRVLFSAEMVVKMVLKFVMNTSVVSLFCRDKTSCLIIHVKRDLNMEIWYIEKYWMNKLLKLLMLLCAKLLALHYSNAIHIAWVRILIMIKVRSHWLQSLAEMLDTPGPFWPIIWPPLSRHSPPPSPLCNVVWWLLNTTVRISRLHWIRGDGIFHWKEY